MRIRKRQSVEEAHAPLPISWKYQEAREWPDLVQVIPGGEGGKRAVCKGDMQGQNGGVEVAQELSLEEQEMKMLKQSDAYLEIHSEGGRPSGSTVGATITDTHWTKRRKLDHETSAVFEGPSAMTPAELLVVNELANGVRQRLHAASGHSTSEQVTTCKKPVENSKDALISSIFFVFDTCGENGLSASEVVKIMLEQGYPGLKEGGARHTVQVANVLRSSSSFVSLGDKRYLLCSSLEPSRCNSKKQGSRESEQDNSAGTSEGEDSACEEPVHRGKQGRGNSNPGNPMTEKAQLHIFEAPAKMVHAGKHSKSSQPNIKDAVEEGTSEVTGVVKVRRRGPMSSQKGKGPTQCKRYDGRGWQCSRLTEPGYSLCVHHQDLINRRAAKLKEAQTMSRILESVKRKVKSQALGNGAGESARLNAKPTSSGDSIPGAPAQKRKMLSLLAIK